MTDQIIDMTRDLAWAREHGIVHPEQPVIGFNLGTGTEGCKFIDCSTETT